MTQNNVAIVTGGSAGIGAEICRSMLGAGYEVISMARRAADFTHPRLHNKQVDQLDADATAQAGAEAAAKFPVSPGIHNAGVIWPTSRAAPRRPSHRGYRENPPSRRPLLAR